MRRLSLPILCLLALLAMGRSVVHAQVPPLELRELGRGTVPVDGLWQFHTGDDAAWAAAGFDDSKWERIEAGKPWEAQGHRDYTGFAWYRRHIEFPEGAPNDWKLALLLRGVDSACEVYWNGALVGGVGKVPPDPAWSVHALTRSIVLGRAQSGVLAIRVWKAPIVFLSYPEEGGLLRVPQVGSAEAVAGLQTKADYEWLRGNQFTLALALFSSAFGLLSLLMWLRNRDRTVLIWLALAMVFPQGELLLFDIPGLSTFRVAYASIGPLVGLNDMALWFLLLAFLGLSDRKQLVRWTKILVATEIGLDLFDTFFEVFNQALPHPHLFLIVDVVSTIPAITIELWGLVIVLSAFRQRLDASRWMLAIAALLADLLQASTDITGLGQRWTHWTVADQISAPLFLIFGSPLNAGTITNTLFLVAILFVAWRYMAEQSHRQSLLEQEYRSAQELQEVLIPEALPTLPGYVVTSAYRPAQEVGGDFFQLIALADGGALLVIGDVSGKGLPAAMAVALLVGAIRSTVEATDDPGAMLAALNRRLHGRLRGGFATCLALRLDAHGGCTIANAGHLSPFLNGNEVALSPALPLGLMAEAEYEPMRLQMVEGDRLTLYTDGLLEAQNAAGELFGFERIAELLATPRDAQAIADAAQAFGQEDDITVLTLAFGA